MRGGIVVAEVVVYSNRVVVSPTTSRDPPSAHCSPFLNSRESPFGDAHRFPVPATPRNRPRPALCADRITGRGCWTGRFEGGTGYGCRFSILLLFGSPVRTGPRGATSTTAPRTAGADGDRPLAHEAGEHVSGGGRGSGGKDVAFDPYRTGIRESRNRRQSIQLRN